MRTVAGLIFSNIHDRSVPELTQRRTMGSVPFGGRYRLIDFTLSNMVNANIYKIGIITHYNYQSLMDHVESGKDWDLNRSSGGIKFLPPFITAYDSTTTSLQPYSSRLEALMGAYHFIDGCSEEYLVLSDCDIVCNIDLTDVLNHHIDSNADITIVTKSLYLTEAEAQNSTIVETDPSGRITNLVHNPIGVSGNVDQCLNIFVLKRDLLRNLLLDSMARGYKSFTRDVIAKGKDSMKFVKYNYTGYFAAINSLEGYYISNMDLLRPQVRQCIFDVKNRPIFTKVKNSCPTKYIGNTKVSNSLIADGCVIEGTVENSVIFRGVHIGKNTVVKDSIIMGGSTIGEDVTLNCVIADRYAVVKNGRYLSGHKTHPYLITKGVVI